MPEGAHGEGHGTDRTADLMDLLGRFMNFTILVIVLVVVVKKFKVKDLLTTRIDEIKQRLDDLKREKEETENKYQAAERKLREFESEKQDIIEQFKKGSSTEAVRVISEHVKLFQRRVSHSILPSHDVLDAVTPLQGDEN